MKVKFLFLAFILCSLVGHTQTILISDSTWKGVGSIVTAGPGWNAQGYNDSGWPLVEAPNAGNVIPVVAGSLSMWCLPYSDTAFMRKTFYIPVGDAYTGSISINADNEFDLYFNAGLLGSYNNWMAGPYTFNISPSLQGCVENVIAIRAANWGGPYGASLNTTLTVINPLNTPVANPPANVTCTSFTAQWDTVATAQYYLLDVSDDPTFSTFFSVFMNYNVGNVNSYPVTGLTAGITYYYRVRAVRNTLTSCYSNNIVFSPSFSLNTQTNAPLCQNDSLFLFAQVNAVNGSIAWTGPNGLSATTDTVSMGLAQPVMNGEYMCTLTITGCPPITDTVQVTVHPVYQLALDTGFCQGQSVTLHSQVIAASGIYSFTLSTSNGCDSIRTYTVQEFPADDTLTLPVNLCYDESYVLPDGITTQTPGTYWYTLNTAHGCDSIVKISIHSLPVDSCVFIIPNVFTPGNDGMNDFFVIKGLKGENNHLIVYNRWGQVVYENRDYKNDWNGASSRGKTLSDGVYYYFLHSPAEGEYKGFVHILDN